MHPGYCTITADGCVAKCMSVKEGSFKEKTDGAGTGYLHRLREPMTNLPDPADAPPIIDAENIAREAYKAAGRPRIDAEAKALGVSPESLKALRCGWSAEHKAFTFPMRNFEGEVIGIRLRNSEGKKWAIAGSSNGIFIPRPLVQAEPIFVVEGPTDCAALTTLGIACIGRPSDTAGTDLIVWWLKNQPYRHVVVMLENNEPCSTADINARRGAGELKRKLWAKAYQVAVLWTPDAKDVRTWVNQGATKEDVLRMARQAMKEQKVNLSEKAAG